MGNDHERREHPRVKIKQTISVANESSLMLAEVDDVTIGGLAVRCEGPIKAGSRFFVVFPGAGSIHENELEAEAIRCYALAGEDVFKHLVAAKFVNPNDKYVKDAIAIISGD